MLSRIADSLFWLNRYMERTQSILRVVHSHYIISLDNDTIGSTTWKPILEIFAQLPDAEIAQIEKLPGAVLKKIIIDNNNPNSIKTIVAKARENARGVQNHITKELWEAVNSMYHLTNKSQLSSKLSGPDALEAVDQFMRQSVLYAGIADITMQRGTGWDFMKLGKYIERSMETIVITDKQCQLFGYDLQQERDVAHWRFLLMSLAGYEVYLKTYRSFKHNNSILHQMLLNEDYPHSVIFSLTRIDRYLRDVTKENETPEKQALIRTFGRLYSKMKYMEPKSLETMDLQAFFKELRNDLLTVHNQLEKVFFSY
ncbi:alpha-E domain-containing protein [Parapedobacter defluvii]|nr:alpha-E domain-containing protein [Parapedobacter defluvii]RQP16404.1 MAG: alpha-E domain-containing protein [Parapedobacter sp.]